MPAWLRRTLIALAVLAALLAAGAAWLIASFDPNRYKGLLIDWMRENRQRTLAIDGPIGLDLFPRLQVTLHDVRLSERGSNAEFAALREAALAVQVMPLLDKQLAIDHVEARGVRVVYRRDAQGVRNVDDLLGGGAEGKAPPKDAGTPDDQSLRFDVSGIALEDVQATVQDAKAGLDGRFVIQKLAAGRLADGAQSPLELVGQAQLTQPAVQAAIDLKSRLQLTLPAGEPARVGFEDLKLGVRGDAFGVKKLDARLEGALSVDGASGALDARKLRLAVSGERDGLTLSDTKLALHALAYDPARRALRLEALELELAGRRAADAIAATLAWPKLEVAGDALKGSALKGTASVKGAGADGQSLQLRFESQAPSGSFERIRVPGLRVAVQGGAGARSVKGEARTDLTLAPAPLAVALDALKLQLVFSDPGLAPLQLALAGQARAGAKDADWRLDGTLNGQRFDSRGRADLSGARPRVEADAQFAALDLTRFAARPAAAGARAPASSPGGSDAPVDLSALKALDGRFGLRAGSLVYPPYRVADAALDATLAGGVLKLGRLSGRAWGGRFDAQGSADANAQRVALKLDAAGVDVAALLGDVADFRRLEGKGRVTADVTTTGASVAQFRQRLGGKAALELRDGALRGINLARVLRQWKSALSLDREAVQRASAEEKTDFSEISASFAIADGVARSTDLVAKSPFLRVGGEGAIDIGRGRVDYLARATVTGTPEGQDGAELAALKGLTLPVRVVGPFDAVDYKPQWSALAAELATQRVKGALSGSAKGAVGELLKGLGGTPPPPAGASAPGKPASASRPPPLFKDPLKGLFGK
jgi:AsmA protein